MDNIKFKGVMPALITPFDESGKLKQDTVRKLMDMELSKGVNGFYICGNTGEGPVISAETRMNMAEVAMDNIKGRGVIIDHIAAADMHEAVRLAKHAGNIGVDAISSIAPTFFYNYTDDELVDYYKAIADATDKPLVVYATNLMKSPDITELIKRLMEIPTVIGLKYTRMNYYEMRKIKELNGGNINVINGPDEMLICGLVMGADAGIGSTYNLMPDWFSSLYNNFTSGNIDAARADQYKINKVITVLLKYGVNGVINSIKCAFEMMGYDMGYAAFPANRFTQAEMESFKSDLLTSGYDITKRL